MACRCGISRSGAPRPVPRELGVAEAEGVMAAAEGVLAAEVVIEVAVAA